MAKGKGGRREPRISSRQEAAPPAPSKSAPRTGPKAAPTNSPTTGRFLFSWGRRLKHQDAGRTGRLDTGDLHVLWFELSEEERKPWNEHAVDFDYSSCPKVLAAMAKQHAGERCHYLRGCGHYGMVEGAAAPVQGFEGP